MMVQFIRVHANSLTKGLTLFKRVKLKITGDIFGISFIVGPTRVTPSRNNVTDKVIVHTSLLNHALLVELAVLLLQSCIVLRRNW